MEKNENRENSHRAGKESGFNSHWENPAPGRVFVKMQWLEKLDCGLSSLRTIAVSSWA
jgi:hypothetical protein